MALMQITGRQIKAGQLEDSHIKGKLTEAVLDINFGNHAAEILSKKLIIDMVQKNAITVTATDVHNFAVDAFPGIAPATTDTTKGIVVLPDLNKNRVVVRKAGGDLIVDPNDKEVSAKITWVVADPVENSHYALSFFDGAGDPFTLPAGITSIDILYPRRFDLSDIPENFLENERFVDGAVDVSSTLNLHTIAKNVFGDSFVYAGNGEQVNQPAAVSKIPAGVTLIDYLNTRTVGGLEATDEITASNIIDEVYNARGAMSSLDARLDVAINDNGTLKLGSALHGHKFYSTEISADETVAVALTFTPTGTLDTPKTTDTYAVYVNGIRQVASGTGKQYSIVVAGDPDNQINLTFVAPGVYDGDVVDVEAIIFGSET